MSEHTEADLLGALGQAGALRVKRKSTTARDARGSM